MRKNDQVRVGYILMNILLHYCSVCFGEIPSCPRADSQETVSILRQSVCLQEEQKVKQQLIMFLCHCMWLALNNKSF